MAVLKSPNQRDEDQLQGMMERMAPFMTGGVGGVAGGGGMSPGGAPEAPSAGARGGGGGGGFTNVSEFVQRNPEAIRRLGGQIEGTVRGDTQAAQQSIQQGSDRFRQDVLAGSNTLRPEDQDVLFYGFRSDPVGFSQNQRAVDQLTGARDAVYAGPRALEETQYAAPIAEAVGQARETSQLAGSASGISELSDRSVDGSRSAGGRTLDSALVRGDQGSRERIESAAEAAAPNQDLDQQYLRASKKASDEATFGEAYTGAVRDRTRNQLTEAQDALQNSLDMRVALARQRAQGTPTGAVNAIQERDVIPTETPLSTVGAQGRYNDQDAGLPPGQLSGVTSIAGRVPQGIDNISGDRQIDQFNRYIGTLQGQIDRPAPGRDVLLNELGLTPEQYAQIYGVQDVADIARRAASGTTNVNPDFYLQMFDDLYNPGDFAVQRDPNVHLRRENVGTAQDRAQLGALRSLAGTDLDQGPLFDPRGESFAGLSNLFDPVSYDLDAALAARAKAIQDIEDFARGQIAVNARSSTSGPFFGNPLDPFEGAKQGVGRAVATTVTGIPL